VGKLTLISGIPGSGKSYFGRWAEQTHGVVVVDVDHGGVDRAGLRAQWDVFGNSYDPRPALAKLAQHPGHTALVWGFPFRSIAWLQALASHGAIEPWWFAGDRDWARRYFLEREGAKPEIFDRQHDGLRRIWPQIAAAFGERVIETVAGDGARVPCEILYRRIFGADEAHA